jgi:hypothetical protein
MNGELGSIPSQQVSAGGYLPSAEKVLFGESVSKLGVVFIKAGRISFTGAVAHICEVSKSLDYGVA